MLPSADAIHGFAEVTGFARAALKRARLAARPGRGQRVNLWPEHFDQAFERGEVTCGLSPGDQDDPRPYLYVLTRRGLYEIEKTTGDSGRRPMRGVLTGLEGGDLLFDGRRLLCVGRAAIVAVDVLH